MKRDNVFYLLLFVSFLAQTGFTGCSVQPPDLMLLIVVFTAVFRGLPAGFRVGLVAGFLRGIFSVHMFPPDVVIFPVAALEAFLIAKMFYKQNPVVQMFIAAVAVVSVSVFKLLYLNAVFGNDLGINVIFAGNRQCIVFTIAAAPPVFLFLKKRFVTEI